MSRPLRSPPSAYDDQGVTSLSPFLSPSLSPKIENLLRESAARPGPALPGDAKAHLLSAYERRGTAPASGLRLVLGGVRWSSAAVSAAAAAALVVFSGSLGSESVVLPAQTGLTSAIAHSPTASARLSLERPLVWEKVHPLPSAVAKFRVVDDQSLPLIGVGWTPVLDGP